MRTQSLIPALLAGTLFLVPGLAHAECSAPSGVCVRAGSGVGWKAGEDLSDKQRAKEARKNRKRDPVRVAVMLDGGRGSVFVDGVWMGVAPVQGLELLPGRHDVQVRDGTRVLAAGVLTVPKDPGGEIQLEVHHP